MTLRTLATNKADHSGAGGRAPIVTLSSEVTIGVDVQQRIGLPPLRVVGSERRARQIIFRDARMGGVVALEVLLLLKNGFQEYLEDTIRDRAQARPSHARLETPC